MSWTALLEVLGSSCSFSLDTAAVSPIAHQTPPWTGGPVAAELCCHPSVCSQPSRTPGVAVNCLTCIQITCVATAALAYGKSRVLCSLCRNFLNCTAIRVWIRLFKASSCLGLWAPLPLLNPVMSALQFLELCSAETAEMDTGKVCLLGYGCLAKLVAIYSLF